MADRFAFLDLEAGAPTSSQLQIIASKPFLNDTRLPPPPPPPPAPPETQIETEPEPNPQPASSLPTDYMELLTTMFGEPDMSLENMDILEVAAMRGIKFDPPRWHRPGGYERKPKGEPGA